MAAGAFAVAMPCRVRLRERSLPMKPTARAVREAKTRVRSRIVALVLVALFVFGAFAVFMYANERRIVNQNTQYAEGSVQQTIRRIDDLLTNAQSSIVTVASAYGLTLESGDVDVSELMGLVHGTPFDYMVYADADGTAYNGKGDEADCSGREYYIEGMRGNSGVCTVRDSSFGDGNALAFYTPLRYGDDIIGVLLGVYTEESMAKFMTTYFFGEQTSTYLCADDGSILARSSVFLTRVADAFELYAADENEVTYHQLRQAFADGTPLAFTYRSSDGVGSAYLDRLPSYDLMVLRAFPASITDQMTRRANSAGMGLLFAIIVAFAALMAVFLVQGSRQRKHLLLEKQEADRIIDVSTELFERFATIDFEKNTYEYLKRSDDGEAIAAEGSFDDFCAHWLSLAFDEDDCKVMAEFLNGDAVRELLATAPRYLQFEYRISSGGRALWLQTSVLCLERDAAGRPVKALCAVQDVSDIKRRELESRNALEEALRMADRASRAKSDFLSSMSHDIRTPMNSIMGLTAIATMYVDRPERVKDCLDKISIASRHLLDLINEVLDMSRIESGRVSLSEENFDIAESMERLLAVINPQIEAKNQILKVNIGELVHEQVVGDPMRLQQVFMNILGNSIKFTPEGGPIGFYISEKPSRLPGSACYEFVFTDTGCGMDEEFLKHIFEPFARAHDTRITNTEGTGLGMAIVKNVVDLMDGTVEVQSALGEGSTFTVTVHLRLREEGSEEDVEFLKGLTVLVVDDEPDACESASLLLQSLGIRARSVYSGEDAVDAVREAHEAGEDFSAVLLDWKMPGKSGVETASEIRTIAARPLPVIILSAYDWSAIEQEARDVGVDAFISKPLFRSCLVRVLQNLFADREPVEAVDGMAMLARCPGDGKRILLTEDNDLAASITKEILAITGAAVERAENGRRAVEMLLEKEPGFYDLVLMDIQMPVMNGYEAAEAIRSEGAQRPDLLDLPIVAFSANAFSEDACRSRAAGMNDHLAKPIQIGELAEVLKKWL